MRRNPRTVHQPLSSAHLSFQYFSRKCFFNWAIAEGFEDRFTTIWVLMWLSLISGISFSGNPPDLNPEFMDGFRTGAYQVLRKKGRSPPRFIYPKIQPTKSERNPKGQWTIGILSDCLHIIWLEKSLSEWEFSSDYKINDWWKTGFNLNFFHANITRS